MPAGEDSPARIDEQALDEWLAFASGLADAAARVTLRAFRSELAVADKGGADGFDPVTMADRDAERAMRERIANRYPLHGVQGEEFGTRKGDSALRWVLDPIDGTASFICGMPWWGTLIALYAGERAVLGCADHPALGERFIASARGAFMHGAVGSHRLATRACASLREAVLSCTDPAAFAARQRDAFEALLAQVRFARYGGDCYACCMLACGHLDLVVEGGLDFHDIAALVPLVEAAGGVITDWHGGQGFEAGALVAAGDVRLHAQALGLLAATAAA